MSVVSEGQLAMEKNYSSVETLSLLFSLNLTTLFHALPYLAWLRPKSRHLTNL
jgi:hypothetical protein